MTEEIQILAEVIKTNKELKSQGYTEKDIEEFWKEKFKNN